MDPARQREIASKGGRAAHAKGTAHEWSSDEARVAGRKGGEVVSRDRAHMAAIGREGGESRGQRAAHHQNVTAGAACEPLVAEYGRDQTVDAVNAFATPKSVTTAESPEIRTLSGLMSRCKMPRSCAEWSTSST